ncbi:hypothetical protein GCM10010170_004620 [Dactylosporangium salmoneum]|uniref:Uncharacterized protein n=1 Tax=Dactylosporangium salmoneum TaxID=53361 RepID=A0ABN3FEY2_9ACTN
MITETVRNFYQIMTCVSESVHPPHRLTDSAVHESAGRLMPPRKPLGGGGHGKGATGPSDGASIHGPVAFCLFPGSAQRDDA